MPVPSDLLNCTQPQVETFHLLNLVELTDLVEFTDNLEEKIRLRDQGPDIEASAQTAALFTDQLAAMSAKHQQAQSAANKPNPRPAMLTPQPWARPTRE